MFPPKSYHIIECGDAGSLVRSVQCYLEHGWCLNGPHQVTATTVSSGDMNGGYTVDSEYTWSQSLWHPDPNPQFPGTY